MRVILWHIPFLQAGQLDRQRCDDLWREEFHFPGMAPSVSKLAFVRGGVVLLAQHPHLAGDLLPGQGRFFELVHQALRVILWRDTCPHLVVVVVMMKGMGREGSAKFYIYNSLSTVQAAGQFSHLQWTKIALMGVKPFKMDRIQYWHTPDSQN